MAQVFLYCILVYHFFLCLVILVYFYVFISVHLNDSINLPNTNKPPPWPIGDRRTPSNKDKMINDKDWINKRLPEVIDVVKLGDYRNTLVGRLSKGYRQRTGIAQAILHDPDVLIMDEPTIGIDPIQVVETRELISELGKEHTMLLSSHILPEVSAICPRVLVINDGRIVADDNPERLSEKLQHAERIEISIRNAENNEFMSLIRDLDGIIDVRTDQRAQTLQRAEREGVVPFIIDAKPNMGVSENIAKHVIDKGWGLSNLTPLAMTLEEIFLQLTTEESENNIN